MQYTVLATYTGCCQLAKAICVLLVFSVQLVRFCRDRNLHCVARRQAVSAPPDHAANLGTKSAKSRTEGLVEVEEAAGTNLLHNLTMIIIIFITMVEVNSYRLASHCQILLGVSIPVIDEAVYRSWVTLIQVHAGQCLISLPSRCRDLATLPAVSSISSTLRFPNLPSFQPL